MRLTFGHSAGGNACAAGGCPALYRVHASSALTCGRRYKLEDYPLTESPVAELLRRSDREEADPETRADCFGNIVLSHITGNARRALRS